MLRTWNLLNWDWWLSVLINISIVHSVLDLYEVLFISTLLKVKFKEFSFGFLFVFFNFGVEWLNNHRLRFCWFDWLLCWVQYFPFLIQNRVLCLVQNRGITLHHLKIWILLFEVLDHKFRPWRIVMTLVCAAITHIWTSGWDPTLCLTKLSSWISPSASQTLSNVAEINRFIEICCFRKLFLVLWRCKSLEFDFLVSLKDTHLLSFSLRNLWFPSWLSIKVSKAFILRPDF